MRRSWVFFDKFRLGLEIYVERWAFCNIALNINMIIFSRSLKRVSKKVVEILKYLYEVYKEPRDYEKKYI